MSEDKTPEWVRLRREIVSIWRGAWDMINRLDDRQTKLERRLTEVENELRPRQRWRR